MITLTSPQVGIYTRSTISKSSGDLSTSGIEELTFEGPNTLIKCDVSECQAKSTFGDYNMQLRLVYLQGKTFKIPNSTLI